MKKQKIVIITTLILAVVMAVAGIAVTTTGNTGGTPEEKNAAYYAERGDQYSENFEYEMALACYRKALEMEPENLAALRGEAYTTGMLDYREESEASYQKLAALLPEDTDVQLKWINAQISAGHLDSAKAAMETLRQTHSSEEIEKMYRQMFVAPAQSSLSSGSYDAYQLVTLTPGSENAVTYYTLDGSEPTKNSRIYQDPIIISYPETTLKVKSFSYLGYESETTEYTYTITVPVEEILRNQHNQTVRAIRIALDMDWEAPLYNCDAAQVTSLCIVGSTSMQNPDPVTFYGSHYEIDFNYTSSDRGRADLKALEYTPFLNTLIICWQQELSLEPLKDTEGLKYLKNLSLLNNNISDISALSGLTGLEKLALGWNNITDISPLSSLENLHSLGLWNNRIEDISPVSKLTNLQYLDIANNQVTSVEAISGLPHLEEFWANGNNITSIAPLDPNGILRILMISENPLTDYSEWKELHPDLIRTDAAE